MLPAAALSALRPSFEEAPRDKSINGSREDANHRKRSMTPESVESGPFVHSETSPPTANHRERAMAPESVESMATDPVSVESGSFVGYEISPRIAKHRKRSMTPKSVESMGPHPESVESILSGSQAAAAPAGAADWRQAVSQSYRYSQLLEIVKVMADEDPSTFTLKQFLGKLRLAMRFETEVFQEATDLETYRTQIQKQSNYKAPTEQPRDAVAPATSVVAPPGNDMGSPTSAVTPQVVTTTCVVRAKDVVFGGSVDVQLGNRRCQELIDTSLDTDSIIKILQKEGRKFFVRLTNGNDIHQSMGVAFRNTKDAAATESICQVNAVAPNCVVGPGDVIFGKLGSKKMQDGNIRKNKVVCKLLTEYKDASKAVKTSLIEQAVKTLEGEGRKFFKKLGKKDKDIQDIRHLITMQPWPEDSQIMHQQVYDSFKNERLLTMDLANEHDSHDTQAVAVVSPDRPTRHHSVAPQGRETQASTHIVSGPGGIASLAPESLLPGPQDLPNGNGNELLPGPSEMDEPQPGETAESQSNSNINIGDDGFISFCLNNETFEYALQAQFNPDNSQIMHQQV